MTRLLTNNEDMGGRIGGIILNPEGKLETTFAWGLRKPTNNQNEAYALFQGLLLSKESNIKSLSMIEDSSIIIKLITLKSILIDNKIATIITRINKEVTKMHKVSFFQVSRELKFQVDSLENEATSLKQGTL